MQEKLASPYNSLTTSQYLPRQPLSPTPRLSKPVASARSVPAVRPQSPAASKPMLASRSIPAVRTQSPTASKSPLLNRPIPAVNPQSPATSKPPLSARSIPAVRTQSPASSKPPLLNRPVPAVNPQSPASSKPPLLNRPVPAVNPQPSTWTRQPKPAVSVASTPSSHFSARTGLGGSVNTEASAAGLSQPSQPSQLSQPPFSTGPFASLAECVTAEKVTIYQCIQSLQYELRLLQDFSANEGSEE
ncbi:hypothetical protein WA577_006734, partial [Blastocystis sp. JDR]